MTSELLPPLDAATEAALRASIQRFGVVVPVITDQNGELLDGRHRVRIAGALGIDYPTRVLDRSPNGDIADLLASLNDDRRQRLTREQRQEMVIALRSDEHSFRGIAKALKIDEKTARNDAKSAGAESSAPAKTTGLDGKHYPATRKPKPKPRKPQAPTRSRGKVSEFWKKAKALDDLSRQAPEEEWLPTTEAKARARMLRKLIAYLERRCLEYESGTSRKEE